MSGQSMIVPIEYLQTTSEQLTAIVSEFESASGRQDDVEAAVARPYGDGRLRDRCHDFEGSWNDSRDKLLTKLKEVAQRVQGTVDEVTSLDSEMATSMEQSGSSAGGSGGHAPVAY